MVAVEFLVLKLDFAIVVSLYSYFSNSLLINLLSMKSPKAKSMTLPICLYDTRLFSCLENSISF